MDKKDLLRLIDEDDLGLLKVQPKSVILTADARLVVSFQEINDFFREKGHEPKANKQDMREFTLNSRLMGIRSDNTKVEALIDLDEHGLLNVTAAPKTIADIFKDDDLGILDDDAESIFTLKHVPRTNEMPDHIARRKPCKDFARFDSILKECQKDISNKRRLMLPFANGSQVDAGQFFVLKGVLLYIENVGTRKIQNKDVNARLRVIFENGTESDMLLRSLSRALYRDGRRVSERDVNLLDGLLGIDKDDKETGFVYILKSLSEKPEIKSNPHLFKIGFSKVPVEERIRNASQEPTYLMSSVAIVAAYKCYNSNPQKMELLLHTFFGRACLDIDVFDAAGKKHSPREWFIAPLEIIEQAIYFLLNGEIVNFKYDSDRKEIVGK